MHPSWRPAHHAPVLPPAVLQQTAVKLSREEQLVAGMSALLSAAAAPPAAAGGTAPPAHKRRRFVRINTMSPDALRVRRRQRSCVRAVLGKPRPWVCVR